MSSEVQADEGNCLSYLRACAFSITLLADTHNTDTAPILASLQVRRPDIVAIAGDILIGYRPENDNLIVKSQENVLPPGFWLRGYRSNFYLFRQPRVDDKLGGC